MKYVALLKPDNDLILKGDQCICTLNELYTSLLESECTELEITKEFADAYFTYRGLCDFIGNTATLFPNITLTVNDIIYKDLDSAVRQLRSYKTPDEFEFALIKNSTRVMQTINEMCKYYFETQEDASIASNKLATMLMQIENLQKTINTKDEQIAQLQEALQDTDSKLHTLVSRVNFRYEKTVDSDSMFHLDQNMFNHILYIKEISRVNYTDTLIYYLREILNTLYGEPVRCVAIEPYYAYARSKFYPQYAPHWNLTYRDVYEADIYMAGFQPKLMKDILQNSNHIHYLIILDRSGMNAPFVTGSNISTLHAVSDIKDAMTLEPKSVISYSEDTLNIPYIDNFDSLTNEEKIQKYSTMPITKHIIDLLETT